MSETPVVAMDSQNWQRHPEKHSPQRAAQRCGVVNRSCASQSHVATVGGMSPRQRRRNAALLVALALVPAGTLVVSSHHGRLLPRTAKPTVLEFRGVREEESFETEQFLNDPAVAKALLGYAAEEKGGRGEYQDGDEVSLSSVEEPDVPTTDTPVNERTTGGFFPAIMSPSPTPSWRGTGVPGVRGRYLRRGTPTTSPHSVFTSPSWRMRGVAAQGLEKGSGSAATATPLSTDESDGMTLPDCITVPNGESTLPCRKSFLPVIENALLMLLKMRNREAHDESQH